MSSHKEPPLSGVAASRAAARSSLLAALPVFTTLALTTACSDQPPTAAVSHGGALSAIAAATAPTLTWLSPLGIGTANPTSFDATAAPIVEVCLWTGSTCSDAPIARFTTQPAGTELPLTVNTTVGQYEATWSLLSPSLTSRRTYRIRVLQGTTELGAVSVDVIRSRWALTRTDGTLAPLKAATHLPIKFSTAQFSRDLFSISGSVPGTEGVTVHVVGPQSKVVTTGADGAFRADGLPPGDYTVSPSLPGAVFEPVALTVALTTQDITSLTFTRQAPSEGLTPSDAARIDAEPETWIPANAVVLPNGQLLSKYLADRGLTPAPAQGAAARSGFPRAAAAEVTGPQQRKNDIVALMVAAAQDYACGRATPRCTKWDFPADPTDPVNKPAQTGLTYIWGGKNPSVRTRPQDGCPQMTYGMDCSGLISRVAEQAGITAPAGSANQSDPAKWSLPAEWQLKWRKVSEGPIETGDLVAWPGHIGIAQSSGATAAVISSTGSPGACQRNIAPPRGPRSLTVAQLKLGTPTAVLRLVTTLSGTFDLYIRCQNQNADAGVIRFTIDNEEGGPFHASGNGVDYDGTPFTATLDGTYDPVTNVLNARMTIPSFSREDAFTLKLLEDDTGYFTMTKVVNNGGCVAMSRLVRVQDPSGAPSVTAPRSMTRGTRGHTGPRLSGPGR